MKTSETITNIAPAILKARQTFGDVSKGRKGRTGKQIYKYANLEDVLGAVSDQLAANGILIMQSSSELVNGNITTYTRLVHGESGEWIEGQAQIAAGAYKGSVDAKAVGSAITYGRRYGLVALLALPIEDDDGTAAQDNVRNYSPQENYAQNNYSGATKNNAAKNENTNAMFKDLQNEINACGGDLDALQILIEDASWKERVNALPVDFANDIRGIYAQIKTDAMKEN